MSNALVVEAGSEPSAATSGATARDLRVLVVANGAAVATEAERATLRTRLAKEADVLFVDEEGLLTLHGSADLGAATRWVVGACPLSVIMMGADGIVVLTRQEQIFVPTRSLAE